MKSSLQLYSPTIPFTFCNTETNEDIDCVIKVLHYLNVEGDPYTWDSDLDYYGYTEIEYDLVNEQGNPLNIEVDEDTDEYIKSKIFDYYEKE